MSKPVGSVTSVSIASHSLIKLLGGTIQDNTPETFVTVGAKWLKAFQSPGEEMVMVSKDDYARMNNGETVSPIVQGAKLDPEHTPRASVSTVED